MSIYQLGVYCFVEVQLGVLTDSITCFARSCRYKSEEQLHLIQQLIDKDLSEPYSIFTYRYFINQWPHLCYLAMEGDDCIGAVVSKLVRDVCVCFFCGCGCVWGVWIRRGTDESVICECKLVV